jgi:hypothetical protein
VGSAAGNAAGEASKQIVTQGGVKNWEAVGDAAKVGAVTGGIVGSSKAGVGLVAKDLGLSTSAAHVANLNTTAGKMMLGAETTVSAGRDAFHSACPSGQSGTCQ